MIKFIRRIFFFALGVILINFLYLFIIQKTDWSFIKRNESLRFKNPNYDLLVLGNSLAMDGIDTEVLTKHGISSYNLAIGGSSLKTSYIQLDEYLNEYSKKPKYVILGLGTYISNFEGEDINPIVEFTMENYKYGLKDLPMVKFKWLGTELFKKIVSKNHREANLKYGQLRFEKIIKDTSDLNTLNKFNINKYSKSKWVHHIEELCSQNNITLLIIEMPGYKNTRNNDQFKIHIIDKKVPNGFLYNLNSIEFCEIFDDEKDWIGNSHLNLTGADKFTKEMIKVLESTNAFNRFPVNDKPIGKYGP